MNLRFLFAVVACGLLWLSGCGTSEFKEFASPEGRFKVQMPGTPKLESHEVAGIAAKVYTVQQRDGGYAVCVADIPGAANEPPERVQSRLDGARDGMVANVGAMLTGGSSITLDEKHPGRNVRADLPKQKGILRAKIYLVNGRLYQVIVTGTKPWASSDDATKFLDSLVVTP